MTNLDQLNTPALVLDRAKLTRNIKRMNDRAKSLGVSLRPHMKTAKSADVARLVFDGESGPITVSTVREAEYFLDHGFSDIFIAVGTTPEKIMRIQARSQPDADIRLAVDGPAMAAYIATACKDQTIQARFMIEVDCGAHRGGVDAASDELLETAKALSEGDLTIAGVFTHGGQSYDCTSTEEIRSVARTEHQAIITAAQRLRDAGYDCPVVSLGSTPTATFAEDLSGVTDMRPGIYMIQDLQQAGLGVCQMDDLALSVLTTVIGLHADRNEALIDAGGLALSKDRGASINNPDPGYGLVCTLGGDVLDNLYVIGVSQEHGRITTLDGSPLPQDPLKPGTRLRILTNHGCMTAAAHDLYNVVEGGTQITDQWDRVNGW
ncbi:MAG: DSD1 family PLP-dependent enzyme [Rhodospirillales bacterium]|jgi:D-serine deaminase-like pyridoxal phosphate-dependent protein|nr:DSD1 family PLP-dependent enzyme [Rhodospirillales bacterium]MBT4040826.1 DSD1 family PLP-dependent enzyme [Rhodospirillales bacterium]MBT5350678.1 DSD1 family PLP-dependent enzyme [Rhodospirillales bacterium]MBT5521172.1 DSD1 family PLP-dependent enzyme [Rhodospirillales bacterium]MBT6109943.1 DSD1 family PLP-dependent enzyme [Rhodospirillales bacterium]